MDTAIVPFSTMLRAFLVTGAAYQHSDTRMMHRWTRRTGAEYICSTCIPACLAAVAVDARHCSFNSKAPVYLNVDRPGV